MKITISGDLGSGKTTVSKQLAEHLGYRYLSTGAIQRAIARERDLTTLELNLLSEQQTEIDDRIDAYTRAVEQSEEDYVVDSRIAWHFIPSALKVFLLADEGVAAQRIQHDASRAGVEDNESLPATLARIRARKESERRRFLRKYGIDYRVLNNYDLIIDASFCTPDEVAALILDTMAGRSAVRYWLSPRRLYPTQPLSAFEELPEPASEETEPIVVLRLDHAFFIYDGHPQASAALRAGRSVVPVACAAEAADEEVRPGCTAAQYVHDHCRCSLLEAWEAAHLFRFSAYPPCADLAV